MPDEISSMGKLTEMPVCYARNTYLVHIKRWTSPFTIFSFARGNIIS
jgi:hypothetical protein